MGPIGWICDTILQPQVLGLFGNVLKNISFTPEFVFLTIDDRCINVHPMLKSVNDFTKFQCAMTVHSGIYKTENKILHSLFKFIFQISLNRIKRVDYKTNRHKINTAITIITNWSHFYKKKEHNIVGVYLPTKIMLNIIVLFCIFKYCRHTN